MFSTKEIFQQKTAEELTAEKEVATTAVTAERNNSNTAVTAVPSKGGDFNQRIDYTINEFAHLTGGTTDRMSGWYAGMIRRLGVDKFVQLAKTAEQEGKSPARYFSWLLKNETA